MKSRYTLLAATGVMLLYPLASTAHEVPNMPHTHAFEETGYGKVRQGHTVNNQYGNITIWSAKPYNGYSTGSNVQFARPKPITQAPGTPVAKTQSDRDPTKDYGKDKR